MWSVPVVSAWIRRSFGIALDQLGENLVGADDEDVGARAHFASASAGSCAAWKRSAGSAGASRSAKNAASRPLIRTSDGIGAFWVMAGLPGTRDAFAAQRIKIVDARHNVPGHDDKSIADGRCACDAI